MQRIVVTIALIVALAGAAVIAAPGITTLPTGWQIRGAQGPVAIVGTLPAGIVISRDGARVIELETGHQKPALRVLDAATLTTIRRVALSGAYGAPLRDPDGDGVWINIAGTFQEQIAHVNTDTGQVDRDVSLPQPFYPVAIARDPIGGTLAVAGDLGNRVVLVGSNDGIVGSYTVADHPSALQFSADGAILFVAERGGSAIEALRVPVATAAGAPTPQPSSAAMTKIDVGLHPDALAATGRLLFVADSDGDDIAVVDESALRVIARVPIPFARAGAPGVSPNALALDGDRLYVSCGAANAIAVFRVTGNGLEPLGAIPTGWYPTAIAVDHAGGVLYVADGKGESGHANPRFKPGSDVDYIADNLVGSVRRQPIPDDAALAAGLHDVEQLAQHEPLPASAIVRPGGPIRHVIYVIKENRSYDEVFGDITAADGDPSLTLFGEKVTPNEHAIARRFGVFDRFFENAHVSADGHNWSTAAFANDYLEKMWPQNYASRRSVYDFEDAAEASVPRGGYLWDDAVAHGVSLRNYGEFVTAGPSEPTPVSVSSDVLRPRTDRDFATFDMAVTDVARFAEWKREFDAYEAHGNLPALEIVRFPRDHTAGTRIGNNTPVAMVADNDLAVGKLVDAVSHCADWRSTAIFVIEDDAQNGADHVDEQRAPFLLASPYAAGGVQHGAYTQASVLRTMEVLLGLPPMSAYDAGARPLDAAFRSTPDLRPFTALPARSDVNAKNGRTAYRALDSARLDFDDADRVDDGTLNDIVWHSVKGAAATPPPFGLFNAR
jgi:DNA-binding beta-propeller fold protein YncE